MALFAMPAMGLAFATAVGFTQPADAANVTFNLQAALSQLQLPPGTYTSPTVLASVGLTFVPNAAGTPGASGTGTLLIQAVNVNEVYPPGTRTEAFFYGPGIGYNVLNCTTLAWTGAGSLTAFTITRPGEINHASIPAWRMQAYDASGSLLSSTGEGDLTNGSFDLTNGQYANFTVASSTPIANVVFCSHNGFSSSNALPLAGALPEAAPFAYVANYNDGTVSVIDTATTPPSVVGTPIPVGTNPRAVAVTPDGKHAYVTNFGSASVSVIETTGNTVMTTITAGVGNGPFGVAVTPDGTHVYVTNFNDNSVSVIETAGNTVVTTITRYFFQPVGVAVTPDGKQAYVTNYGGSGQSVSVIDTGINLVTRLIYAWLNTIGVAITPDGTRAYVANAGSNNVSVIDTASNTVVATVPAGSSPAGVAVTPDGKHVYVTNYTGNNVSVIETASNMVVGTTITVGNRPNAVAVSPDGTRAYVTNQNSNTISVIDTGSNTVVAGPPTATPLVVGNNPVFVAITPSLIVKYTDYIRWSAASNNLTTLVLPPACQPDVTQPNATFTLSGVTFTGSNGYLVVRTPCSPYPGFIYGGPTPPSISVTVPPGVTSVGWSPGWFNRPFTPYVLLVNGQRLLDPGADPGPFVGFTSSTPITSLQVSSPGYPTIGGFTFGFAGNTVVGSNVVVTPIDTTSGMSPVTLTFPTVAQTGTTTLTTSGTGSPPPAGFALGNPPTYYDLSTTAGFSGPVKVCINYSGVSFTDPLQLKLFHFEGGTWVDRTFSRDTANRIICANVASLSPFAVFERAVPFSAFSAQLQIHFGGARNQDAFALESSFTLSSTSPAINPLTQPVTLRVGPFFATTIPPGSFKVQRGGAFTFVGVINGVSLQALITPLGTTPTGKRYAFAAAAERASLTGTTNLVQVTLTIGDDSGTTSVRALIFH
jgi:YVTN family beta-propeller protein